MNETLRSRTHSVEERNTELVGCAKRERRRYMQHCAQNDVTQRLVRQELVQLHAALHASGVSSKLLEERAAEDACRELLRAWNCEREHWSHECSELRQHARALHEEVKAVVCMEETETHATMISCTNSA